MIKFATDTPTSWRIGDGTASLYNLAYYLLAGFTENDVLRSNLIRKIKLVEQRLWRGLKKKIYQGIQH